MEKEYSKSKFVDALSGGVMCYGDGDMDRPIALVQVNMIEYGKLNSMTDDEKYLAILNDLNNEGKIGGLAKNEKLAGIHLIKQTDSLTDGTWTPENNMLTASNKLNRQVIQKVLESELRQVKELGIHL